MYKLFHIPRALKSDVGHCCVCACLYICIRAETNSNSRRR